MSANSNPTTPAVSSEGFIIIGMETTSLPTMESKRGHVIDILSPAHRDRVYWNGDHQLMDVGCAKVEFLTFGISYDGVRATHTNIHLPGMSVLEADNLLEEINSVSEGRILGVTKSPDRSHGMSLVDIEVEMGWLHDNVLENVIALLEAATTR